MSKNNRKQLGKEKDKVAFPIPESLVNLPNSATHSCTK